MSEHNNKANASPPWQQSMEKVMQDYLKESKRRRRWGIFFKGTFLILALILVLNFVAPGLQPNTKMHQPHASVVDIKGAILPGTAYSANHVIKGLTHAFHDPNSKGIILRINSPGGSPVQASHIFNSIMRLRHRYPKKKIYTVCNDICASGAYYVAAATNDIYANQSSLVGSIGVLLNGFGFTKAMKKLGVERRLITAGNNKDFLDPFSPLSQSDRQYAHKLLDIVHQQFIHDVKKGRGKRLADNPRLFSGLIWTGSQAKKLGLIDDFASTRYVIRQVINTHKAINYTEKQSLLERLGKRFGSSFSHGVMQTLTQQSMQ
jgi:protease-4